jgi:tetratricopeptide (TPR) repeat protein
MALTGSGLKGFWRELRRRKVVRVAIAYAIGAGVLLQFGDTLLSLLSLPEWAGRLLVAVVVLGLPVAIVLAWVFDFSPEGIVTDPGHDGPADTKPSFGEPEPIDVAGLDLARPRLTKLVGRQEERGAIRKRLEQATRGEGGILLIGGEPGVGKTRLAEEALEMGRELGMLSFVGHAYEEHGAPFIIASEVIEAVSRTLPATTFRNVLGDTAPEIARLMPELRRTFRDIPEPMELPPEQQQRYLFNAMLEFTTRLTRCGPVIMLLDDLHWADESSTLLLEHITPHLPRLPLLMVVTYRDVVADMDEPFRRTLTRLGRLSFVSRISLKDLSRENVAELLASLGGTNPPDEIVGVVFHETGGNAFFVQSVYQHLAEEGRLFDTDGRWLTDIDADSLAVPDSVRLVIERRLERMSEATRVCLNLAAVMGLRFDPKVVTAASRMSQDDMIESIEQAEAASLILPTVGQRDNRYEFTHALVRQALLEALSPLRRDRLHLVVAEAMEQLFGEHSEKAADIARHLYLSGDAADADKTVRYLMLAADRAVETGASNEAVEHLEKALTLVPEDKELERAALLLRCGLLRSSAEVTRADEELRSALDIFRKHGRSEEIAQIIVRLCFHFTYEGHVEEGLALCKEGLTVVGEEASGARCSILSALGLACALAADVTQSKRWHDEAEAMAGGLESPELLAEVLANRGISYWQSLNASGMVRAAGRAVELNRSGYRAWELKNSLTYYVLGLTLMGRFDEAWPVVNETLELAIRDGDSQSQMMCDLTLGMLHAAAGDLSSAVESAKRSVEINERQGLPWGGHFYGVLAELQMRAGDWDSALESYVRSEATVVSGTCWDHGDLSYSLLGMAIIDPSRFDPIWERLQPVIPETTVDLPAGRIQTLLAAVESLATLGRMGDAGHLYPRVREIVDKGLFVQQFHSGLIEKTAGIGATAACDMDAAEAHFRKALQQADELPHLTEQGEVRRWYARMLLTRNATDDAGHARRLLVEAIAVYERCGMARHKEMTEEILKRVPGNPA